MHVVHSGWQAVSLLSLCDLFVALLSSFSGGTRAALRRGRLAMSLQEEQEPPHAPKTESEVPGLRQVAHCLTCNNIFIWM